MCSAILYSFIKTNTDKVTFSSTLKIVIHKQELRESDATICKYERTLL